MKQFQKFWIATVIQVVLSLYPLIFRLDTSILLASALNMDANWKNPFYKTATVNGMFHKADGSSVVVSIVKFWMYTVTRR